MGARLQAYGFYSVKELTWSLAQAIIWAKMRNCHYVLELAPKLLIPGLDQDQYWERFNILCQGEWGESGYNVASALGEGRLQAWGNVEHAGLVQIPEQIFKNSLIEQDPMLYEYYWNLEGNMCIRRAQGLTFEDVLLDAKQLVMGFESGEAYQDRGALPYPMAREYALAARTLWKKVRAEIERVGGNIDASPEHRHREAYEEMPRKSRGRPGRPSMRKEILAEFERRLAENLVKPPPRRNEARELARWARQKNPEKAPNEETIAGWKEFRKYFGEK